MRSRRTGRSSSRRTAVWARQNVLISAPPSGVGMVDLLQPYRDRRGVTATPGVTVERVRATFRAALQGATAPDSSIFVGIRRCNVDEQPVGNGPFDDPHADWMYFQRMWSASAGGAFPIYDVDVKSRRKIHELEQTVCLFAESPPLEDASTLTGTVSVLLLLP